MPAGFTAILAEHLDKLGGPRCSEAVDGELLLPGKIYMAPGEKHLTVEQNSSGHLIAKLNQDPQENFCRPSVDPMLRSAVKCCEGRILVAILTGMGHDGLAGCKMVVAAGGTVIAQDEASSVVWGMPGAVSRAGLATEQMPPNLIGERIAAIPGIRR
jgi:two-component system chemotaxis response regulator CheB